MMRPESCVQYMMCPRVCAESSTDSVRQHHKLFWPDHHQSPVHVCSSAGVFVSIVLVDADHVCTCI